MKALSLSLVLILAALPGWTQSFNASARQAFNYEREGDDWDGNCCTSPDPVDSNMCFDSWEEYDQACKPEVPTAPPAPAPREPDEDKI